MPSDSYRQRIELGELKSLAQLSGSGGEDTIKTYYTWREARALTVSRGLAAAALSLLTAWVIPYLKGEYKSASPWLIVATPLTIVLTLAVLGLISLLRMDRIHASYVRSMVWLERFR